jgi:Domain of unknown function (DUF4386)
MSTSSQERPNDAALRRTARIAGWWWVLTFLTSIPALLLYDPLLNDSNFILSAGTETRIQLGAVLEVGLVISGIATAVVMYPVLKRQSQSIALGYVACRIVESCMIAVGIVSVLSVLTLRDDLAANAAGLGTVGQSLVAVHDATFLLGPAFCAGFGNGLLLGYLMYTSGLVPRRMALIGLIGGPLSLVGATFVLFGAWEQTSATQLLFTLPEAVWELSLGIYLIVKGFKTASPLLDEHRQSALDEAFSPTVAAP